MVNFMSQGFGFDVHVIFDPGHLIDDEGVRTSHIDQHFTVNLFPGFQRHPLDLPVRLTNLRDFCIKEEFSPFGFSGDLEVVGCELRITDLTRTRSPNGTLDLIS